MILFPNAKINIGLHVTGKREDGFHNIESLFYPVPLCDILEVTPLSGKESKEPRFYQSGVPVDCEPAGNLCVRAWIEMNKRFKVPAARIHLHKVIPLGSGLGGGSSDAAFVLYALNNIFSLGLGGDKLAEVAAVLGSDCPFFIYNRPAFVSGRGELMEESHIDLSGSGICVIYPGTGINTALAYSMLKLRKHDMPLKNILSRDTANWQGSIMNDFEPAVSGVCPEIGIIRQYLADRGAWYSSMTGSGSAVYGLFKNEVPVSDISKRFPGMFIWSGRL